MAQVGLGLLDLLGQATGLSRRLLRRAAGVAAAGGCRHGLVDLRRRLRLGRPFVSLTLVSSPAGRVAAQLTVLADEGAGADSLQ